MDKRGREAEGHAGAHHTMQGAQRGGTSSSLKIRSNTHPRENVPLCSGGDNLVRLALLMHYRAASGHYIGACFGRF